MSTGTDADTRGAAPDKALWSQVEYKIDVLIYQRQFERPSDLRKYGGSIAFWEPNPPTFAPVFHNFLSNIQSKYATDVTHSLDDTLEYLSFPTPPRAVLLIDFMSPLEKDLRDALKLITLAGSTVILCTHINTRYSKFAYGHWESFNREFRRDFNIPSRWQESAPRTFAVGGKNYSNRSRVRTDWKRIDVLDAKEEVNIYLVDGKMRPSPARLAYEKSRRLRHNPARPKSDDPLLHASLPEEDPNQAALNGPRKSGWLRKPRDTEPKFDRYHHPALFGRKGKGFIGYVAEFYNEAGLENLVMKMLERGLGSPAKATEEELVPRMLRSPLTEADRNVMGKGWHPFAALPPAYAPRILHSQPRLEAYRRMIDTYRLWIEESYIRGGELLGVYEMPSNRPPYEHFKRFLRKLEAKPEYLPRWWDPNRSRECRNLALIKDGGAWIGGTIDEIDVRQKYADTEKMEICMRMLAMRIYERPVEDLPYVENSFCTSTHWQS